MTARRNNLIRGTVAIYTAVLMTSSVWGQSPAPTATPPPIPPRVAAPVPHGSRPASPPPRHRQERHTTEKTIKVDSAINVSLPCVTSGTVKVSGWNRNELRVFMDSGSRFNFTVQQKSRTSGDPVWIKVAAANPENTPTGASECIGGDEIEIDVPMNAAVVISGREIVTQVDSIRKTSINSISGDVTVRNVTNGVSVKAGRGDIVVEESEGTVDLDTTSGNVLVFEAGPSEIGDVFKAKSTGGTISLQKVSHRQVDVSSISGSVVFMGEILNAGSYSFRTSKGSVTMAIPESTSCQILASYGYGSFDTEFPIRTSTAVLSSGPTNSVRGTLGKGGEAIIKINSTNGRILLKKI